MDKTWLKFPRPSKEYRDGAKVFVKEAIKQAGNQDRIHCPCKVCQNQCVQHIDKVYEDLIINGMDPTYNTWVLHGEQLPTFTPKFRESETFRMFRDAHIDAQFDSNVNSSPEVGEADLSHEVDEAERPLYKGCEKFTKLSAIVALFKHKASYGLSDQGFDKLLEIIGDMLPEDNTLPTSLYLTKKLLKVFNLGYEKIDACINDCCLFRKEFEHHQICPKCGSSRWKKNEKMGRIYNGVAAKALRYFSIIPRFRRMFCSPDVVKDLIWHSTHKSRDGKMRHPVDSIAWDVVDSTWPNFASDPRSLRLGLATDGFNPFSNQSTSYSCWPVILVTYNLPPWSCMSKENMMLTLLIPGPKQPGNDIDIYLQPLIEDLIKLWNGVEMFDALSNTKFNLRAVLLWTIHDFPAYGNVAGCKTKGKFACPVCSTETSSLRLHFSHKHVYMDHRRFLPPTHEFRRKKIWFNGKEEFSKRPRILTGEEVLLECKKVQNEFGKMTKKRKKDDPNQVLKKMSIFFELPYWQKLCMRNNLDFMHVEKNICDSIIGTLLDLSGKTKDGLNSRRDLEHLGIRPELHAEERGSKFYLPPAPHTLSKAEKKMFCSRLFNIRLPDGYSSNISNCVVPNERKITGLKSHDCHVLIQQLLSVALCGLLPIGPRNAIFRLCAFFNELSQRVIDRGRMQMLEDEIVETICLLERYFPPSFFDIMLHLSIHLPREARLCGPVQYRWMYPFERYMKVLKGYVRNRARPEGCIAEGYLADECLAFCTKYISQVANIGDRSNRNDDYQVDSITEGHPISKGDSITLSPSLIKAAHRYILFNSKAVEPYTEMHMNELKNCDKNLSNKPSLLENKHRNTFSAWLYNKVTSQSDVSQTPELVKWLAFGPSPYVKSYTGYIINGKRIHTKLADKSTQDSDVSLEAETICRASAKDNAQVYGTITYYGVIKEIYLLEFHAFKVPLFKCDWANTRNGVKIEDGFTLVNLHQNISQFERDPFIQASQARQVFYSRETETSDWYTVLRAPPRGFHDLESFDENAYSNYMPLDISSLNVRDESSEYARKDCEGSFVNHVV